MGGGGKTQQSSSSVSIPPEVLARYSAVNAQAQTVAQTPFQQYSTDPSAFVAQLTPTQQAGIAGTNANANTAQPYYQQAGGMNQQASNMNQQAAGLIGAGGSYTQAATQAANPLTGQQINNYMNPYMNTVLNSTEGLLNQQNQQAQAGQMGNAITSGAFGGDRAGIAAANLNQQQMLAGNNIYSGILNQGYNTALQTAQQQQQQQVGALMGAGSQFNTMGGTMGGLAQGQGNLAQGQGNIGAGAQTAGLAGAQAQMTAGQAQQQTGQAGLTALYNQFLQQQSYPFQTTQFLANIAEGTGALSGSNTTSTSPAPFFSDANLKEGIEPLGKLLDGSTVVRFRYRGRPEQHIGFIAQDVEKHNPGAVGMSGGYKTVDYNKVIQDAAHIGNHLARGLAGGQHQQMHSSMGGGVSPQRAGLGFARGGYADGGYGVDYSGAPWAGNMPDVTGGGPYGNAGEGLVKSSKTQQPQRNLMVAKPPQQQQGSGVNQITDALKQGESGYKSLKGLLPSSIGQTANSNTPPAAPPVATPGGAPPLPTSMTGSTNNWPNQAVPTPSGGGSGLGASGETTGLLDGAGAPAPMATAMADTGSGLAGTAADAGVGAADAAASGATAVADEGANLAGDLLLFAKNGGRIGKATGGAEPTSIITAQNDPNFKDTPLDQSPFGIPSGWQNQGQYQGIVNLLTGNIPGMGGTSSGSGGMGLGLGAGAQGGSSSINPGSIPSTPAGGLAAGGRAYLATGALVGDANDIAASQANPTDFTNDPTDPASANNPYGKTSADSVVPTGDVNHRPIATAPLPQQSQGGFSPFSALGIVAGILPFLSKGGRVGLAGGGDPPMAEAVPNPDDPNDPNGMLGRVSSARETPSDMVPQAKFSLSTNPKGSPSSSYDAPLPTGAVKSIDSPGAAPPTGGVVPPSQIPSIQPPDQGPSVPPTDGEYLATGRSPSVPVDSQYQATGRPSAPAPEGSRPPPVPKPGLAGAASTEAPTKDAQSVSGATPPGLAGGQQQPQQDQGGQGQGPNHEGLFGGIGDFFNKNQQWLGPLGHAIAGMAGSNSRYLGAAILQGVGAGLGDIPNAQTSVAEQNLMAANTGSVNTQTQKGQQGITQGQHYRGADGQMHVALANGSNMYEYDYEDMRQKGQAPLLVGEKAPAPPDPVPAGGGVATPGSATPPPAPDSVLGDSGRKQVSVDANPHTSTMTGPDWQERLAASREAQLKAQQDAANARNFQSINLQLAQAVSQMGPGEGGPQGAGFNELKAVGNQIAAQLHLPSPFDGTEVDRGQIIQKLNAQLSGVQGGDTVEGLRNALNAIPGLHQDASAAKDIIAHNLVNGYVPIEKMRYINEAATVAAAQSRGNRNAYYTPSLINSYGEDHGQPERERRAATIRALMDQKINGAPNAFIGALQGKIPRELINNPKWGQKLFGKPTGHDISHILWDD